MYNFKKHTSIILLLFGILIFSLAYLSKYSLLYYVSCLTLSISLFISAHHFLCAFIIVASLLVLFPSGIHKYSAYLLNSGTTDDTIYLVCWFFLTVILVFLILAYNIKNTPSQTVRDKVTNYKLPTPLSIFFHYVTTYNLFIRVLTIFLLYILILYSLLNTFGVLYAHLSQMFNEGIEGEHRIFSHLDALYFSATTFFTIGFGDITPSDYSEITKQLVIIQALLGHIFTTVLWPIVILFVFNSKKKP